jgi:hypothetical protein
MDVLKFFHLSIFHPYLNNYIPIVLRCDVQVAFHFPLDKLGQDLYNVATWHLHLMLPHWCFVLPPHAEAIGHNEMQIRFKHFLTNDWENL